MSCTCCTLDRVIKHWDIKSDAKKESDDCYRVKLPTLFYGHFNMSSLCDIKYTLVGIEGGAKENGREKQ